MNCFVFFLFFSCHDQVLRVIVYRQNKVFHARADGNKNWVKYDATFVVDWERENATPLLRSVHPCYLWLANHCFDNKYFHVWYKEVNDNIKPSDDNKNNDNNCNNSKNGQRCNSSYPWFKMNCFMSFAFNCTRYAFSHYQTQIAKSVSEVCNVILEIWNSNYNSTVVLFCLVNCNMV